MTYCKSISIGVLCAGLCFASNAFAQVSFNFENIDTMLTDNLLDEAAKRYSSVILSFHPEQATRLGFSSANNKLNTRSQKQTTQMLTVLYSVRESLKAIDVKQLSEAKQADYQLLLDSINMTIWQEEQGRFHNDPLYYTQSLDAIYDLITKSITSPKQQRADLAARLTQLPQVAEQAKNNVTNPAPFLAQLAMEKAYYAYLSADEWETALQPDVTDPDSVNQAKRLVYNAKQAVKTMFDHFKQLSQQTSGQDFRLGKDAYFFILKNKYQWIGKKQNKFLRELDKDIVSTQTALTKALDTFLQQEEESDEVTVVDGLEAKTEKPAKKRKNKDFQLRNAQDFYAASAPFMTAEIDEVPLQTLDKDAQEALTFLIQQGALPKKAMLFNIDKMPQYYAYDYAYLFQPPFGDQLDPKPEFLLRVPTGNKRTQQEQFNQDFNAPTRKLMISKELVPGRYLQAQNTLSNSAIRRLFPSESTANGWSVYAQQIAKDNGYLSLDEELLFVAWNNYLRSLAAWTDANLHTRQYSYTEAMDFLTQTHGLQEKQAENILKYIVAHPGEAVSYQIGLNAFNAAHEKFRKKQGKKFNEADFNAKLFQIGNVPPDMLEDELSRLYKRDAELKKLKESF